MPLGQVLFSNTKILQHSQAYIRSTFVRRVKPGKLFALRLAHTNAVGHILTEGLPLPVSISEILTEGQPCWLLLADTILEQEVLRIFAAIHRRKFHGRQGLAESFAAPS